jgi:hypothetical protein
MLPQRATPGHAMDQILAPDLGLDGSFPPLGPTEKGG